MSKIDSHSLGCRVLLIVLSAVTAGGLSAAPQTKDGDPGQSTSYFTELW